ncbi:MAG: hypothetical protein KatS3mg108_0200 [Isosphaeraceae bacterium]|jgi:Flp pilus assembly protein TadD|nr:MAG: hypothetical protein KatS3mg108_0200 [Isosphaeraceae bacterium]
MATVASCAWRARAVAGLVALLVLGVGGWAVTVGGWPPRWTDPLAAGRAAYDRGDYEAAARVARERLREAAGDPDALRLLARSVLRQGRVEVAQGIYQNLSVERMQAEDCLLLAAHLAQNDNAEGARKLLRVALEREPDHPEVLAELARLLALADQLEEARGLAERLSRIAGHERRGWILQGLLYHELGQRDQAARALGQALTSPPGTAPTQSEAEIRKLQAHDLLAEDRPTEALAVLEPLAGAPDDPEVPWLLSRVYLRLGDLDRANAEAARAGDYLADRPLTREPAPYVGAARCAPCHRAIHRDQQSSHHAATFALAADMTRWTLPEGPWPDRFDAGVIHRIDRTADGALRFTTTRGGDSASGLIEYVFGSGDRGATPVGRDQTGSAVEFRQSYYGGHGWDVTSGHRPIPDAARDGQGGAAAYLGRRLDVDNARRCFECHVTDTRAAMTQAPPTAADHGIGCERCHGPGGNHVLAMEAAPRFVDVAIVRPRLASPAEVTTQVCGRCHSPRGATPRKTEPTSIRFQSTTLTWSKCYTESRGALGCTSCHGPHNDAVTDHAYYEAKCLTCHAPADQAPTPPPDDPARPIELASTVRRVPCPVNASTGCVDCHMPVRDDIVPLTPFTDHWIRVHPPR